MAIILDEMTDVITDATVIIDERPAMLPRVDNVIEPAVELGIWLSGLEIFLADTAATGNPTAKVRLIRAALERCLKLNARLYSHSDEMNELGIVLRESLRLSNSMHDLGPTETNAWCRVVIERLASVAAFHTLVAAAERAGEQFLPEPLKTLAVQDPNTEEEAELALVLPRFGKILMWLSVVGKMLEVDEPLKPALIIFARVNEQTSELVAYINNRLSRFSNEEAELFGSLDAASYTASIALRRVFSKDFSGLLSMRAAPSVYASIESAYAILNEGLQQILGGIGHAVDPSVNVDSMFPGLRVNFDRSLVLRRELWALVRLTQAAEQKPEKAQINALRSSLRDFTAGTIRFLFYKDTDTFERFVEEILVTQQTKDLVPLLHRFGAYLETLFGQVSLRAVLEDHPFEG